jgi:uncharacterized membrane protein SpoIIM required for sporulation
MISTQWIEKHKPYWNQLERLLRLSGKSGLNSLKSSELRDLSMLYRQIASDLAAVREDPSSLEFTRYLNQLLVRAHSAIYTGRKTGYRGIITFFSQSWPLIFRKNLAHCLIAMAVFCSSALIGASITFKDPDFKLRVLSQTMVEKIEQKQMWTQSILSIKPQASSRIMTNNISVSFLTYALGITAGVGTLFELLLNGLMIGVVGSACWAAGMSAKLWSFLAPHGVLELPAIFIAGGAGLKIAQGLLFPGILPRKESLMRAGRQGTLLVLGTIPLLIVAGVIEAFVSPDANLPIPFKFAMAAALFALLLYYLFAYQPSRLCCNRGTLFPPLPTVPHIYK